MTLRHPQEDMSMAFFELPRSVDVADSGPSTRPAVDMTDPKTNKVLQNKAEEVQNDQPTKKAENKAEKPEAKKGDGMTDEQRREARMRVVSATAKVLESGVLDPKSKEAIMVVAAIDHQLRHGGGVKAADSLDVDISAGLPKGMKLEIKKDAEFEAKVKKFCKENGEEVPNYIRVVTLSKDGKEVGRIGVTAEAPEK